MDVGVLRARTHRDLPAGGTGCLLPMVVVDQHSVQNNRSQVYQICIRRQATVARRSSAIDRCAANEPRATNAGPAKTRSGVDSCDHEPCRLQ